MNTIFFELDETLIPIVHEKILEVYFDELGKKFSDLADAETVIRHFGESMEMVLINDGKATNEVVFKRRLSILTGSWYDTCLERLEDFYRNEFKKIRQAISRNGTMINVVKRLKEKGYTLVVASKPVLPKKAIIQILQWGGYRADDFDYITTMENSSFSKPNVKFYNEILEKLDKEGEECLMVGCEPSEDMIANRAGINSYLLTDYIVNKGLKTIISDYVGNTRDFSKFAEELPDLSRVDV